MHSVDLKNHEYLNSHSIRCAVPCCKGCPPCNQPCLMRCEHLACSKKCGEPCVICRVSHSAMHIYFKIFRIPGFRIVIKILISQAKCTWQCEHKKCTKQCGVPCDREPCNEPCKKELKCGHICSGLCGEPCPPLCYACDKEFMVYEKYETENAK